MSVEHHGTPNPQDEPALRRFVDEVCGRASANFPQGKINKDDLGETAFAIASNQREGIVIIRFTKPVDWLGLDKKSALQMSALIAEHANNL